MKCLAGEVWKIGHSRKGVLTVRLLQDLDLGEPGTSYPDVFFDVEIVEGRVHYASRENRLAQKYDGAGTPGDVITLRSSLCTFFEVVKEAKAGG